MSDLQFSYRLALAISAPMKNAMMLILLLASACAPSLSNKTLVWDHAHYGDHSVTMPEALD